ncbi:MAG: DUF6151 family protein [Pseudoxanthomonas sp.]
MALSLRCQCGQLQGTVETDQLYVRATCYCHDCQAYARWLDRPGVADAQGGTDIVAMNPAAVRITAGQEQIACMSLSPKGLLRWYAVCCRTPLGNTPREGAVPYVGIVTTGLSPAREMEQAFGPKGQTVINSGSAQGQVKATPWRFVTGGLRIAVNLVGAKLRKQKPSLFFDDQGQPIRTPQALSAEERQALGASIPT